MKKLSLRQHEQSQVIQRLKSLQTIHDNMLDNMFDELSTKFSRKEISDRFWDAVPAELKNKYKSSISNIRSKIRDIIMQYPQYYSQYKNQNKPYFQKMEKQNRQREELLKSIEEAPFEEQQQTVGVGH